jgi:hypothetical protein
MSKPTNLMIDAEKVTEIIEILKECETLLTERISDLHEVKGGMQARHTFILYRQFVFRAYMDLRDNLKAMPPKND